jgi:hypothetical protein
MLIVDVLFKIIQEQTAYQAANALHEHHFCMGETALQVNPSL